ncbi:Uncharacterised protein [Mycobacteroides abscessus subsp. abscessus]|nr:Uncharacterised protein [Mycobacteroides abscessus subsp. abscessus]
MTGKLFDHRDDTLHLDLLPDRRRTRPSRLATDIDDVRARGRKRQAVCHRVRLADESSTVREGVVGDIDDSQDVGQCGSFRHAGDHVLIIKSRTSAREAASRLN